MKMTAYVDIDDARDYLARLDLSYLADAMCAEHYPLARWTRKDALHCIELYKKFLWLHKLHPEAQLVPTREIDECWHNHILHTKAYLTDCLAIFGHYLHHAPATPGENDAALATDYANTKNLYKAAFGEELGVNIAST